MNNSEFCGYIGVGSNISPEKNIKKALKESCKYLKISKISTFYRTKPLLTKDQDDYLNGVWEFYSTIDVHEIKFNILRVIEEQIGRVRTEDSCASRTIDLDILLYSDLVINEEGITIPDPDIYKRYFIVKPLMELNADIILPDTKSSISEILDKVERCELQADIGFTQSLRSDLLNHKKPPAFSE